VDAECWRSRVVAVPLQSRAASAGSGALARVLRIFGRVEQAEAGTVALLLLNVFVLLFAYYLLKTVREPLILATGGAEMKSYAAAFQAAALVAFVPAYGWLSSRMDRSRLIVVMVLVFAATVEVFYLASLARVPYLGFAFFVWVGIFSNAAIALFWSYASDLHGPESGQRLFPVIAVGAAAGSPVGSKVAELLFAGGMSPYDVMHVGALLLVLQLALYRIVERRTQRTRGTRRAERAPRAAGPGGFGLVLRSPYLRLVAVLFMLLNLVNTTGEYILGRSVVVAARLAASADPALDVASYIGAFYGRYYFWVNVASVILQAFLVSRIVRRVGLAGALFALPLVAFGAYALVAAGAGLGAIRWAKGAENAVDYSAMNTGKQLLWLPTGPEEKYEAKQAIDSFFVRAGDLLSAAVVFAGTTFLGAGIAGFAFLNLILVVFWVATAWVLVGRYRSLCATCR
jgi:ATP:ADP antiporter, AAA family